MQMKAIKHILSSQYPISLFFLERQTIRTDTLGQLSHAPQVP